MFTLDLCFRKTRVGNLKSVVEIKSSRFPVTDSNLSGEKWSYLVTFDTQMKTGLWTGCSFNSGGLEGERVARQAASQPTMFRDTN